MNLYFLIIICYLIGSFPSGFLIAKFHGLDIAKVGSGNVGASNVGRTLGKKAGILTLALDVFKGFFGVTLCKYLGYSTLEFIPIFCFVLVAGHCISIPFLLKGGKGVATAFGSILALNPIYALIILLTFIVVFKLTRIVSVSSLTAATLIFLASIYFAINTHQLSLLWLSALALLVVFKHKDNIGRIIRGEEKTYKAKN